MYVYNFATNSFGPVSIGAVSCSYDVAYYTFERQKRKRWRSVERRIEQERNNPLWFWGLCAGFCVVSGGWFLCRGEWLEGLLCLGTLVLVTLPVGVERVLGWKLDLGLFVFLLLYAMGPMLGKAYKLYYLTGWWDKLLHTCGGVAFAVLGTCLAGRLNGGRDTTPLMRAVFGLCFSIAISAVWELFEYGVDTFFGADMQNDTVVTAIHSYLLSDTAGVLFDLPDIREVAVNGVPLEVGGYLDIGLVDTMGDVLVETIGAVVFEIWYLLDKEKHSLIEFAPKSPNAG